MKGRSRDRRADRISLAVVQILIGQEHDAVRLGKRKGVEQDRVHDNTAAFTPMTTARVVTTADVNPQSFTRPRAQTGIVYPESTRHHGRDRDIAAPASGVDPGSAPFGSAVFDLGPNRVPCRLVPGQRPLRSKEGGVGGRASATRDS